MKILKPGGDVEVGDTFYLPMTKADAKEPPPVAYYAHLDEKSGKWSRPWGISQTGREYLTKLALGDPALNRASLYARYWNSADEAVARDVHEEINMLSDDEVRPVAALVDRQKILARIEDPKLPASRLRLAYRLLEARPQREPADIAMLKRRLLSDDPADLRGLDCAIACYLTLHPAEEAVALVEKRFLSNREAEYQHTYAAIMALRYHIDLGVLPKQRLVRALRLMLQRPELADLVVIDLAKAEDWESMNQLVELFKTAEIKGAQWVRVPTIRYLRVCPLPAAEEHLRELKRIDPDAFDKAGKFGFALPEEKPDANGVES